MEYHELEETFAALQSPRSRHVTGMHPEANRILNGGEQETVGENTGPDYQRELRHKGP